MHGVNLRSLRSLHKQLNDQQFKRADLHGIMARALQCETGTLL